MIPKNWDAEPEWDRPEKADSPTGPAKCCGEPTPDRTGRSCDKPKGHDGDHWTYGGNTLTWAKGPAEGAGLRAYVQHTNSCAYWRDGSGGSGTVDPLCDCGLDALLAHADTPTRQEMTDHDVLEQAARLLRIWAGDRQRLSGKWTGQEQAAIECAIRLEQMLASPSAAPKEEEKP